MLPGNKRLKLKKVRKEAGIRITLSDPKLIAEELNLVVGAISPFIFPPNTKYYMDPTVLEEEFVDVSTGHPLAGIRLKSKDILKLVDAKVCDIVSDST